MASIKLWRGSCFPWSVAVDGELCVRGYNGATSRQLDNRSDAEGVACRHAW
ncbi:hypothetical protein [Rhizobium sp. 768_B6_N1_8]|uniref:hypothetical protein n=1 Tax=unclassified Rhizobium TaxID=2613769 RepID=UPI003F277783